MNAAINTDTNTEEWKARWVDKNNKDKPKIFGSIVGGSSFNQAAFNEALFWLSSKIFYYMEEKSGKSALVTGDALSDLSLIRIYGYIIHKDGEKWTGTVMLRGDMHAEAIVAAMTWFEILGIIHIERHGIRKQLTDEEKKDAIESGEILKEELKRNPQL